LYHYNTSTHDKALTYNALWLGAILITGGVVPQMGGCWGRC